MDSIQEVLVTKEPLSEVSLVRQSVPQRLEAAGLGVFREKGCLLAW